MTSRRAAAVVRRGHAYPARVRVHDRFEPKGFCFGSRRKHFNVMTTLTVPECFMSEESKSAPECSFLPE